MTAELIPLDAVLALYERGEEVGVCTACGFVAFGVPPVATEGECPACGERAVHGIESLLLADDE